MVNVKGVQMSPFSRFMRRGPISPRLHGALDYPLAAVLVAGPLVLDDRRIATVRRGVTCVVGTRTQNQEMAERTNGSKRLPWFVYAIPILLLVLIVVYAIVASWTPAT
jgi:hypothetical protein